MIFPSYTASSSRNKEILKLIKAYIITSLTIWTNFNPLVAWEGWILIPPLYIDLSFKDNIRRKHLTRGINILNRSNLFPIAWLYKRCFPIDISSSYYFSSSY